MTNHIAWASSSPLVSIIVVSHNEGRSVTWTVWNLVSTAPASSEIIVVNDFSTDGSCESLRGLEGVRVLHPVNRLGASAARNFGARHAKGRTLVFCDAHVVAPRGWFWRFDQVLQLPGSGAVGPVYRELNSPTEKGYGLTLIDYGLNWDWMSQQSSSPYAVPFLGGYFLALRAQTFWKIGGFDQGLGLWGMEDLEFALRAWLLGFDFYLHPDVEVGHLARDPKSCPTYQMNWQTALRNIFRIATIHFCQWRIRRVFEYYLNDRGFTKALARVAVSDAWERRAKLLDARHRSDDFFFERFHIHI